MNDTVKEWIAKAALDYATARRELEATKEPNFDAVPAKSHDLVYLSELLTAVRKEWSWPIEE